MWIGSSRLISRLRAALCCGLTGLAACGGGTDAIEPFEPNQIILLGDETTVLTADGKNYSINGLDANNAIDCTLAPIWSQLLVGNFGMTLDRCNPNSVTPRAVTRGAPGAKAADIEAQITAQLNASAPSPKDLFLLMVGLNDIIERFEAGADCGDDELEARGRQVAQQVNRLAAANVRTILVTVHDVGLTPYARTRNESARLTCLTATFNARVRVDILQDGRFIGLVLADDLTQAMTKVPAAYSLTNVSDAACTVALPDCTSATLVSGAESTTHLWADDRHFGLRAHANIASFAITRARNNPF
jgi:lysophospholipase L1-like esterase